MRCLMKSKWSRSQRASVHVCVSLCACVCVCLLECLSVYLCVLRYVQSSSLEAHQLTSIPIDYWARRQSDSHWLSRSLNSQIPVDPQSILLATHRIPLLCTIVGGPSFAIVAVSRLLSTGIEWRNYSFGRWRDNRRRMLLPQQPDPHSLVTDGLHHIHVCHP